MRAIYMFFLVISCGVLFLGASGGPGAVQGKDRTGGPLSEGFCGNCHTANAFNPSISLKLFQDGNEINGYEPGQTYTMQVTINADAAAQVYGFQAVALAGGDNQQAGSWTAIPGTQVTTLNDRDYIEHSMRSDSETFAIEWTAPGVGSGDVSFYAAGVAANNADGNQGDGGVALTNPTVLNELPVGLNELSALAAAIDVFPNPVMNQLNLRVEVAKTKAAQLRVYNLSGQVILEDSIQLIEGSNTLEYDLNDLPAGLYTLELSNGAEASITKIIKQ